MPFLLPNQQRQSTEGAIALLVYHSLNILFHDNPLQYTQWIQLKLPLKLGYGICDRAAQK